MRKIKWVFQKFENYWFVIPKDKKIIKWDFYINKNNFFWAKNWDLVEIEVFEKNKWKNKEAKIINILEKEDNKKWEKIIWTYSISRNWEFWFIDIEWQDKWFFVHNKNSLNAMDWDIVEAYIKIFNWKKEAEITKILEAKKRVIVWKFEIPKWKNYWFVIPKNKIYKNDIFVAMSNANWAKNWDLVWVEVTKATSKNPEWKIKEILSDKKLDKREEDILILALESWAKINFPEEVKTEIKSIGKVKKENLEKRINLENLFTFTIDSETAKDLDDAISIEKKQNWDFILYVSIADVSHYVKEKSALDNEALERATSIYMADRVIPMLPEELSNWLCSLNPKEEKLTLTCEMHIWAKTWQIFKKKVYESILKSDFRLTYKEVDAIDKWEIKENDLLFFEWKVTKELLEKIKQAQELKNIILKNRINNWVLDFDFPETYIKFDEYWNVIWIYEYERYKSNKLIEVFMVCANEAISKEFSDIPFLYRIHEKPNDLDIISLKEKLNLFWVNFKFKDYSTLEFSKLLNDISKLEETKRIFLEKIILRTLSQAMYSSSNLWHFWLWLNFYSHFTSPIRRYPDLQIHRIIKEKISWKYNKKRENHYKNILDEVALKSTEQEKMAEKLEYKVRDYFIVKYYKNKIWQEFNAIISWVISKWFFISLEDTAEWFVELKDSIFNEELQSHKFKNKKYQLWDKLKVILKEADEELLRLNFDILD